MKTPSSEELKAAEEVVEAGLELFRSVFGTNHPEYYKGLVMLAVHYTAIRAYKQAFQLLSGIPASYYAGAIQTHLAEDPLFMSVAIKVADSMSESGLVQPPVFYGHKMLVQPVAKA